MTAVRITLLNLEVSLCRTAEDGAATDICCGPLGMKRATHVIRPKTMTRTNTTGSADDMAVTVASERLGGRGEYAWETMPAEAQPESG
jgi:hypothetical protein